MDVGLGFGFFEDWGFVARGFRVGVSRLGVSGSGFRVRGLAARVFGFGVRGFRGSRFRIRVRGFGFGFSRFVVFGVSC